MRVLLITQVFVGATVGVLSRGFLAYVVIG
jgi:hypothetical protein